MVWKGKHSIRITTFSAMGDGWSALGYRYYFLLAIGDVPDGYGFGEERSKTMLLCGMNSREKSTIGLRVAQ